MRKAGWKALCAVLAVSVLCGCGEKSLATYQQDIYKQIDAQNTQQAYTLILQADAIYPGMLDSALYTYLLDTADQKNQQDAIGTAYRVLAQRSELTEEQWVPAANYFIGQEENLEARQLLELAAAHTDNVDTLALLNNTAVALQEEGSQAQALLTQAADALKANDMGALLTLAQSTDWLNQMLSPIADGIRCYQWNDGDSNIRIKAWVQDDEPIFCAWRYHDSGAVEAVRVVPNGATWLTGTVAHEGYQGAFTLRYLDRTLPAFYTITGTVKNNVFQGKVQFEQTLLTAEQAAALEQTAWQNGESELFTGTFADGAAKNSTEENGTIEVGRNADDTKSLRLHIPTGESADTVGVLWLPVAAAEMW
jgi:hypothetical protein